MRDPIKDYRLGEKNVNRYGTEMIIVEYNSAKDIMVEFQDNHKYRVRTNYQWFSQGIVSNPFDKTLYKTGYIGVGKYKPRVDKYMYNIWQHMMRRCYNPYYINTALTYKDCIVHDTFHCFQNFGDWFVDNYYKVDNETMNLDKDILHKGNKIYGPDTCVFVPARINRLVISNTINRGKLPLGVHYSKSNNKYIASCSVLENNNKKRIYIGCFDNPNDAFEAYKEFKEKYIKMVADEYKDRIPEKLYEALYRYKIEIND